VLNPPGPERRYTKAEMLAVAAGAGLRANEALFDRWVTAGLLDFAQTVGRGKGRGILRTWPESQRNLWLTLLGKRREITSLRTMANGPVFMWLMWGDSYVPQRQAQRALETWAEVTRRSPRHGYHASARGLVRSLAAPKADKRATSALIDALADMFAARRYNPAIERLLVAVVGPSDASAQTDGPRVAGILEAQMRAREDFATFKTWRFGWARAMYLMSQLDYSRAQPYLATDSRFGHLNKRFDVEYLFGSACNDMLLILGLSQMHPPPATFPDVLTFAPWEEGRGHIETKVLPSYSGLWTPRGAPMTALGIEARIWLGSKHG
jgi:hypothetical protein